MEEDIKKLEERIDFLEKKYKDEIEITKKEYEKFITQKIENLNNFRETELNFLKSIGMDLLVKFSKKIEELEKK